MCTTKTKLELLRSSGLLVPSGQKDTHQKERSLSKDTSLSGEDPGNPWSAKSKTSTGVVIARWSKPELYPVPPVQKYRCKYCRWRVFTSFRMWYEHEKYCTSKHECKRCGGLMLGVRVKRCQTCKATGTCACCKK